MRRRGWSAHRVVALLVLALAVVGIAPAGTVATAPSVVTGVREGTITVSQTAFTTVASLDVPAGDWVVLARIQLEDGGIGGHDTCRLRSGRVAHRVTISWAEGFEVMSLRLARHLASKGAFEILCKGHDLGGIRMVAIRAGKLTQLEQPARTSSTTGSGSPAIRFLTRTGTVQIPKGLEYTPVASMHLPAGRWLLDGLVNLQYPGPQCLLQVLDGPLGTSGESDTARSQQGSPLVLGLTHALAKPADVVIRCRDFDGSAEVGPIRLTAIALGSLTEIPDAGDNGGQGTPVARSAFTIGPVVLESSSQLVSLSLPAGDWVLTGNLEVSGFDSQVDGYVANDVTCSITGGDTIGTSKVEMSGINTHPLLHVVRLVAQTTVAVRCTNEHPDLPNVKARRIRLTALRAGALTIDPLRP